MKNFTVNTKNVNSETLTLEISDYIEDIIERFNIMWESTAQRDSVLEILDEHMEDLVNQNKIEQWDIVCDGRNNKKSDIKNNITNLSIQFKQRNCYNTTEINYVK